VNLGKQLFVGLSVTTPVGLVGSTNLKRGYATWNTLIISHFLTEFWYFRIIIEMHIYDN